MKSMMSARTIEISSIMISSVSRTSFWWAELYFRKSFSLRKLNRGSSGRSGWKGSLKKLCRVLPPALMAAMPVGANTTCFFRVWLQIYFSKVDLPVPALPVRKTELRVNCMSFSVLWNSGF